jgi:CheY-like chemotaxis protein
VHAAVGEPLHGVCFSLPPSPRACRAGGRRAIRESLQDFFEDNGYAVDAAANGSEALARLNGTDLPCVIILDLLMRVLDGNMTYAAMQQDPRLARLPVIISTSDPGRALAGPLVMKSRSICSACSAWFSSTVRTDGARPSPASNCRAAHL